MYNENLYAVSAIDTRSIRVEIDKVVGLIYFAITALAFVIAAIVSSNLTDSLVIYDNDGAVVCDSFCIRISTGVASGGIMTILSIIARKRWNELDDKCLTAGFHKLAINNEYATSNSVENMTRAIEQNDWEIAKDWREKIEEEIKYKKGKREIVIKVADIVYTPLHKSTIAFQNSIKGMKWSRRFPTYDVNEWDTIKTNSSQSLIEETDLRSRIESFYDLVSKYNEFMGTVNVRAEQIISQQASEIYGKNVRSIDYDVESPQGSGKVELFGCALFDVHPLDYYIVRGKLRSLRVEFINEKRETQYASYTDTTLFDKMWELVRTDVKNDPGITKMHEYFEEIKKENGKLSKIFSEKIAMQLKV